MLPPGQALTGLCDARALGLRAWQKRWADVAYTLARAVGKAAPPKKSDRK